MEAFVPYLFRSMIWLTGFALIYLLFLQNERFFLLKRFYLVSGILISFIFPLFSVHYLVELPAPDINPVDFTPAGNPANNEDQLVSSVKQFDYRFILLFFYISGILFLAFRMIWHVRSLCRTINKANIAYRGQAKLIRASEFPASFSFFSYIFINPSVSEAEMEEIMNHELIHVGQKHWFDLMLVEMLCLFQWVNPFAWFYSRFIRMNHEYLADEAALKRSSDPARYKVALLNQIFSSPVISLSNSFNYSLSKKRFNMMKNVISSPYRKMKVLLVLPVFAVILYSFAKPEYHYLPPLENQLILYQAPAIVAKEVKGIVVQQDGKPLQGAAIIVKGTTIGVITDAKGYFKVANIPDESLLVVSYVGFKTKVVKPVFTAEMTINMMRDTMKYLNANISILPPPPPPPPPANSDINFRSTQSPPPIPPPDMNFKRSANGISPLVVVDGIITDIQVNKVDPNTIESIDVLKDISATKKYGEKGKDGVIEITTKKSDSPGNKKEMSDVKVTGYASEQKTDKDTFIIIEEIPEFPGGGKEAMEAWISENMNYPPEAVRDKITGRVYVNFIVSRTGEIKNVKVETPLHPLLDTEAIRVISNMPDWKPGKQAGRPVDVQILVPVEFNLQ